VPPAAVDIGGTKIQVVDAGPQTAQVAELATPVHDGPDAIVDRIAAALTSLPAPGPVVVASAGSLDVARGVVHYAANLPFTEFPLTTRLEAAVRRPVRLIGDAVAAAVGEFTTGAAAGHRDGVYITVSTGIGMGIVIGGRLVTGRADQAGELGHIPVVTGPRVLRCSCGQSGCLEAYASGRALAARAAAAGVLPAGPGRGPLTARDVVARARAGDTTATALLDETLGLLATGVACVVRLLAPPVVVLGGGLLVAGGLLDPLRRRVAAILAATVPDIEGVMLACAHGRFSSVRGAALIARADPTAIALLDGTTTTEDIS